MPVIDPNTKQQIKQLVADGQLPEALTLLEKTASGNITAGFRARHGALKKKELQGTISQEDATVEFNQIVSDVLEWTDNPEVIDVTTYGQSDVPKKELIQLMAAKVKESLTFYYWISGGLILLGAGLFIFFFVATDASTFGSVSSVFVGSISAFPGREIFKRRNQLTALEVYLARPTLTAKEVEFINTMLLGKGASVSF